MLTKARKIIERLTGNLHVYALGKFTICLPSSFPHDSWVWMLSTGVCIMCGKQTVKWEQGYALCGFYLFLVVSALYIIMHIVLTFCFAELISIAPFTGGGYGYSRCSLGPRMGYMAGIVELGKYLIYTVTSVTRFGLIFQDVYGFGDQYLILCWLLFFVAVNVLHLFDMELIWVIVTLVGVTIVSIQIMFVIGAMEKGTTTNLSGSYWDSDPQHFLMGFPYAAYLMVSSDAVRTCVDDESKTKVPKALLHVLYWSALIACATMVSLSAYVYSDSSVGGSAYSYNKGFSIMFPDIKKEYLPYFALPGTIGCAFGFLYCSARQMRSMACSGLLLPVLSKGQKVRKVMVDDSKLDRVTSSVVPSGEAVLRDRQDKENGEVVLSTTKPTLALIVCSTVSFVLIVVGYYKLQDANATYTNAGSLLRCIQYCFLMMAYIAFATRFSGMTRELKSPFGMYGALAVLGFFAMLFVSALYYDTNNEGQGIMLVVLFVLGQVYYSWVVEKRQFFSKEEQEKFLKAYIVNANKQRKSKSSKDGIIAIDLFHYFNRVWANNKVNPGMNSKERKKSGGGSVNSSSGQRSAHR
eukprot:scaffold3553_cov180-Ochromonas_danica.AAC.6